MPIPLASTTAGPLTPMVEFSVAMMTSQQASSVAFPAKQSPVFTPTNGTKPLSLAKSVKTEASHTDTFEVAVGSPLPLGEKHQRNPGILN